MKTAAEDRQRDALSNAELSSLSLSKNAWDASLRRVWGTEPQMRRNPGSPEMADCRPRSRKCDFMLRVLHGYENLLRCNSHSRHPPVESVPSSGSHFSPRGAS